jgi:hypothetical protein
MHIREAYFRADPPLLRLIAPEFPLNDPRETGAADVLPLDAPVADAVVVAGVAVRVGVLELPVKPELPI